jgi:hypothetical protein
VTKAVSVARLIFGTAISSTSVAGFVAVAITECALTVTVDGLTPI